MVITGVVDQRWIAATVFLLLAVVLFRLQQFRQKGRKTTVVSIAAVLLLAAGAAAVYGGVLQPVEAVHFLLFSWLGWISASTFGILYGTVAVLAVSFGDEILQYYLPDRVGDMHDILINSVSGCIGLIMRGK